MIRILLSTRLGERRWSQADLARATGIRPSTINDLYHEIAERINLEHLDLICEALGCELSDLMIREENKETRVKTRTGADIHSKRYACSEASGVHSPGAFSYISSPSCVTKRISTVQPSAAANSVMSFSVKFPRVILLDRFCRVCPDASARSPIVIFCLFMIRRIFSATESPILSPPHSYYTLKCVACQKLFYDFHEKM